MQGEGETDVEPGLLVVDEALLLQPAQLPAPPRLKHPRTGFQPLDWAGDWPVNCGVGVLAAGHCCQAPVHLYTAGSTCRNRCLTPRHSIQPHTSATEIRATQPQKSSPPVKKV